MNKVLQVTCETKIAKCTDSNSGRYALGNVMVAPADSGAFLVAGDGAHFAIVKCPGDVDKTTAIPAKAVRPGEIEQEGDHWKTTSGVGSRSQKTTLVSNSEVTSGLYPKIGNVLERVNPDWQTVCIDATLLKQLADAINTLQGIVTLFVREEGGPIMVIGENGIGVIGPCNEHTDQSMSNFNAMVDEFRNHFHPEWNDATAQQQS